MAGRLSPEPLGGFEARISGRWYTATSPGEISTMASRSRARAGGEEVGGAVPRHLADALATDGETRHGAESGVAAHANRPRSASAEGRCERSGGGGRGRDVSVWR